MKDIVPKSVRCLYCKEVLTDPIDISKEYHESCNRELLESQNNTSIFNKKIQSLALINDFKNIKNSEKFDYFFTYKGNFKENFKKLITFDFIYDLERYVHDNQLLETGIVFNDKREDIYLSDNGEIYILYRTTSIEFPDYFYDIPSLGGIFVFLDVSKYESPYPNPISNVFLPKCYIKLLFTDDIIDFKVLEKIPFQGVEFYPEFGFDDLKEIDLPKDLSVFNNKYNIENALLYPVVAPEIEPRMTYYKRIIYINQFLQYFPNISDITYENEIFLKVNRLKYVKHLRIHNPIELDNDLLSLKDLSSLEIKKEDAFDYEYRYLKSSNPLIHCKTLNILILEKIYLVEIPASFRFLKELEFLSLEYCNIEKLPKWLEYFKKLKFLFLKKNSITEFPFFLLKSLDQLKVLDLRYNPIEEEGIDLNNFPEVEVRLNYSESYEPNSF